MADRIFAYMTATSVDANGREENGWIDPAWSRTELYASREDVRPLMENEGDEFLADEVRDILGDGSFYQDNGDGNFCGIDSTMDPSTGARWTYVVHFKRVSDGVEKPWHPVNDGGISLG